MPIEYRQAWSGQEKSFQAEVQFHQWMEIERILRNSIQQWFSWYEETNSLGKQSRNARSEEDIGEASVQVDDSSMESDLQATTSFDTFRELFANRPEFANDEQGKEFLARSLHFGEDFLLDNMIAWTEDLLKSVGENSLIVKKSADSVEELTETLKSFIASANRDTGCPHPWRLISIVR